MYTVIFVNVDVIVTTKIEFSEFKVTAATIS